MDNGTLDSVNLFGMRVDRVDMAGDVEAWIVGPTRVAEAEGRRDDPPAEAGDQVQTAVQVAAQGGERGRRAAEADGPADVHGGSRGVEREEGLVESREAVGGWHGFGHPHASSRGRAAAVSRGTASGDACPAFSRRKRPQVRPGRFAAGAMVRAAKPAFHGRPAASTV